MAKGLGIVRPPTNRQPEDISRDGSQEIEVPDVEASRIFSPLADYVPLIDEARSKTADPICLELAAECDRLMVLISESYQDIPRKPAVTASIVARRLSALKLLGQRMDEVDGKEQVRIELSTISEMITIVKEIMRETGVAQETREIIYQKLLARISDRREESRSLGA